MLADVCGQEEGVLFLRRVVSRDLTSPLLLVGEEGTGRRFSVLQATKEIFCTGTRASDCGCVDCVQVDQGAHPDLITVAPEGDKEIGVDIVREMLAASDSYPTMSPFKIFIVDGADRMTYPAANAFLKTLEEPPSSARFFLLAESQKNVIPTIRSRCGRLPYRPLSEAFILTVLQRFEEDPVKALVYTRMSEGSVGRAVRYWGSGRIGLRDKTFALLQMWVERDLPGLFSAVDGLEKELPLVLRFLEQLLHDVFMLNQDHARLIHLDLAESLGTVGSKVSRGRWQQFARSVRELREKAARARLFLPFHVKAVLAQVVLGG